MSLEVELQKDGVAVELLRPHDDGAILPLNKEMIERLAINKSNIGVATEVEMLTLIPACHTAEMSVTSNYSRLIRQHLHPYGLKWLHGMTADDTILPLANAVEQLGVQTDPDYWAATPGNVGHCLNTLLSWAREHPDATWEVI